MACGPREYVTNTQTFRAALGVEGPLSFWEGWNYSGGASYARSEASSVLGAGYYYRGTLANGAPDPNAPTGPGAARPGLVGVMNSGLINPFSLDQTEAGLAALAGVSAEGETLYGGRYEVNQYDVSVSGPLFPLWGGDVQVALGVDYRQETYEFNGSEAAVATAPVIFLAAFDNINALTPKHRDVRAAYVEVLAPLTPELEVTGAVRVDDYTGFGTTTNPKFSVRFRPVDQIMLRGSYNTSFRVPTFNQIYNGITESPYSGSDIADPFLCPGGVPNATDPNCAFIRPNVWTGGTPDLGPETAEQFNFGVVFTPSPNFTASVDWWSIDVDSTITELTVRQLIDNAALFPERFIRANPSDPTSSIVTLDRRWINAGARQTEGLEITLHGAVEGLGGTFSTGLEGTYLLRKREKLSPTAPFSGSQIGVFTFTGDLGLEWKHNAYLNYSNEDFSVSLTQIFRDGYRNFALPGIASGAVTRPEYNEYVESYVIYNTALSYTGIDGMRFTFGVKNIFDTDPPFAITYDGNAGAGGSWEPRAADPRGRSFVLQAEAEF
jgi:iron complex outermembrane receptor protein